MKLHLTTSHEYSDRDETLRPCASSVCRFSGYHRPHVCLSSEPLRGQGKYVYTMEIPIAEIREFEYTNTFRQERARHFAVPLQVAAGYPRTQHTFEEIVGRPWNQLRVSVQDRNPPVAARAAQGFKGAWSLIWMSRQGVAVAHELERLPGSAGGMDRILVEVNLTDQFDPDRDYLIVEEHQTFETERGKDKEKWQLCLCAGVMPKWGVFPWAWSKWVWDEKVFQSAIDHILQLAPHVKADIAYARDKDSKTNKGRAWRIVSDEVGRAIGRDLGALNGVSWTAVRAMPMRIANRAGGWTPPVAQPEFEHPDQSGRVLLANETGAYPETGNGTENNLVAKPAWDNLGEPAFPGVPKHGNPDRHWTDRLTASVPGQP